MDKDFEEGNVEGLERKVPGVGAFRILKAGVRQGY